MVQTVLQRTSSSFESIDLALAEVHRALEERITEAKSVAAVKIRASSELDIMTRDLAQIATLQSEREDTLNRLRILDTTFKEIDSTRDHAKKVSETAEKVRSDGHEGVNTFLNKVRRDLFIRLAPSEQFVPAFRLPIENSGKVEAVLETLHRSGKVSGSPGAMLSQGNLNTAALTLFLHCIYLFRFVCLG